MGYWKLTNALLIKDLKQEQYMVTNLKDKDKEYLISSKRDEIKILLELNVASRALISKCDPCY